MTTMQKEPLSVLAVRPKVKAPPPFSMPVSAPPPTKAPAILPVPQVPQVPTISNIVIVRPLSPKPASAVKLQDSQLSRPSQEGYLIPIIPSPYQSTSSSVSGAPYLTSPSLKIVLPTVTKGTVQVIPQSPPRSPVQSPPQSPRITQIPSQKISMPTFPLIPRAPM